MLGAGFVVSRVTTLGVGLFTVLFIAHVGLRLEPNISILFGLQMLLITALRLVVHDGNGADAIARVSYGFLATGVLAKVVDLARGHARWEGANTTDHEDWI